MFQTVYNYSDFHAAARCVSGGPIYINDVPGKHNLALVNQMTGTSPSGKKVVFRLTSLSRTIELYSSYDDEALLKIGTYYGMCFLLALCK
jgi:hypothetical protein